MYIYAVYCMSIISGVRRSDRENLTDRGGHSGEFIQLNAEGARPRAESLRQTDRADRNFSFRFENAFCIFFQSCPCVGQLIFSEVFMQTIQSALLQVVQILNSYLSDYILIVLLIGTGIFYTVRTCARKG